LKFSFIVRKKRVDVVILESFIVKFRCVVLLLCVLTCVSNFSVLRSSNSPQCRALFDYTAQRGDELDLVVGDIVTILREDEGWWEGELGQ